MPSSHLTNFNVSKGNMQFPGSSHGCDKGADETKHPFLTLLPVTKLCSGLHLYKVLAKTKNRKMEILRRDTCTQSPYPGSLSLFDSYTYTPPGHLNSWLKRPDDRDFPLKCLRSALENILNWGDQAVPHMQLTTSIRLLSTKQQPNDSSILPPNAWIELLTLLIKFNRIDGSG